MGMGCGRPPPPGQTPPPWADTSPRADTPLPAATAADGTHPTRMHSCVSFVYAGHCLFLRQELFKAMNASVYYMYEELKGKGLFQYGM